MSFNKPNNFQSLRREIKNGIRSFSFVKRVYAADNLQDASYLVNRDQQQSANNDPIIVIEGDNNNRTVTSQKGNAKFAEYDKGYSELGKRNINLPDPDAYYLDQIAYLPQNNPDPSEFFTYDPSRRGMNPFQFNKAPQDTPALNDLIYGTKIFWPKNRPYPWEFVSPPLNEKLISEMAKLDVTSGTVASNGIALGGIAATLVNPVAGAGALGVGFVGGVITNASVQRRREGKPTLYYDNVYGWKSTPEIPKK